MFLGVGPRFRALGQMGCQPSTVSLPAKYDRPNFERAEAYLSGCCASDTTSTGNGETSPASRYLALPVGW